MLGSMFCSSWILFPLIHYPGQSHTHLPLTLLGFRPFHSFNKNQSLTTCEVSGSVPYGLCGLVSKKYVEFEHFRLFADI